jgi:translocation and assembly module TamA
MLRALPRPTRSLLRAAAMAVALVLAGHANAQEVTLTAPGASGDLVDRLRANALLLRPPEEGTDRTGDDITAAARADYGRLVGVLYEAGFFAPVVAIRLDGREASDISPFSAPDQVARVEIEIETGPPFRLGRAEIGPLAEGTILPEGFAPGAAATTPLLQATTRAALEGWAARGHATAAVGAQRIVAQNRAAVLDVAIAVEPGPVIRFGALIPEGQSRMRVARIVEIAGLPTGDIYAPQALDRAEERLRDTGVFAAVALRLDAAGPDDIADVEAILAEAPLRRLGFGAEIASDEGLQLSAYWLHRNLLGGAERLRFDLEISGIQELEGDGVDTELRARFERPATFTPDTILGVEGAIVYLQEPRFTIEGLGFETTLRHRVSRTVTVEGGLGLTYAIIDDALGDRSLLRFTLPMQAIYENRDDPVDPRGGAYADLGLTPFRVIGGSGGLRATLDARGYRGFGAADRTRLAARMQIGGLFGGDLVDIAPDDLFYSGGSGTVRGQAYRSLGAVQAGRESGGRGFLGLSGELRHDIGDTNFGIVGFADAGFISAGSLGDGASDWHAGVGVGLRYATPFGPIRVDLATPANGGRAGQEIYLYIGIGQAF